MEILKNSLFCRFFMKLGRIFARGWKSSAPVKIDAVLHESWLVSGLRRRWLKFADGKDLAEESLWKRVLLLLERILLAFGAILEKSFLYKAVTAADRWYHRISRGSFVLENINRLSLRRWLLVFFACYLPIEYLLRDMLSIGFLASVWEECFIILAAAVVLWRACLGKSHSFAKSSAIEVVILIYCAVSLGLMFLTRKYAYIGWLGLRAQVEYLVWFLLIFRLIESKDDARFVIWAFGAVVLALAFHGIYQFIIAVPNPAGWTSQTEMSVRTRVFSLTGSPNIFGSLLVLAAPIPAAAMYYMKKPAHKFLCFCATGVICLSDLFTFSRGSWVGLIVAICIFAFFIDRRLFGIMGVGMAGVLMAVPSIASRIAYLFTSDYTQAAEKGGRTLRWEFGLELLRDNHPWLGYGLGRFGGAVAMNNQVQTDVRYFYLDNYYLKTLVESGYIGLGIFILLLVTMLVCGIKAAHRAGKGYSCSRELDPLVRNEGNDRLLCIALLAGMCGVMFHCYFENIFEEPYMMAYFWGLAAAMVSLGRTWEKE